MGYCIEGTTDLSVEARNESFYITDGSETLEIEYYKIKELQRLLGEIEKTQYYTDWLKGGK